MTDEKKTIAKGAAGKGAAGKSADIKGAEILPLRAPRRCANCSKETVRAYYPFCSKRCKDIDLHHWLSGRYAIPVVEGDAGGDDDA